MPQLLSCPKGHRWQPPAAGDTHFCPLCADGRPDAPADEGTLDDAVSPAAPPPGPDATTPPASDDADPTVPPPSVRLDDATHLAEPHARPGPSDSSGTALLAAAGPDGTMDFPPPGNGAAADAYGTMDLTSADTPAGPDGTEMVAPDEAGTAMYIRADAAHPAAAARPGRRGATAGPPGGPSVPGYEVLGVLGRGAMGVVYKARQVGLNRLVALKMILSGEHAGARELARFRVEAEAVAKLQHPNIVQVYEINSAGGRPYFCLEFVGGGPLDKKLGGDPQPFREAAGLVRQLADAMHYAHERRIIHRDLKPANVLLTADGSPKVTDFGLAKKLDDESAQTQSGSVMGTPSYMSPEQAQGRTHDLGPASDQYSLGAILYEMLVGRPPFKGETILETLEQAATQEPTPPSRLRPKTPRDLETICLKCLQKEPGRRYADAGALAEDLRRWLAGEPILARPAPAWERGWKWVRRRPLPAALAAVSALFVLCLVVGGAAFGLHERQQADEQSRLRGLAETANGKAEANFRRAERNYGRARSAVDQMLTGVGQERLAREPRMEKLRRELLTRALAFYNRFLDEDGADAAVRRETGRANLRVGDIREMLGDHAGAEQAYAAARGFFDALRSEFPDDPGCRRDLAVCLNNLGGLLKDAGRTPEAERAFRDALGLRQKLVEEAGGDDDRRELAKAGGNLGVVLLGWGRYAEAEDVFRQSLRRREELAAASPAPAVRLDLARGRDDLGVLLAAVGRADDAGRSFASAVAELRALKDEDPSTPDHRQELAVALVHQGDLRRDTNPRKAEEYYRESLALRAALADDFPTVPTYRQEEAAAWHSLGFVLQAVGRHAEAEEAYGRELHIAEALADAYPQFPDYPFALASAYNGRGVLLHTTNRLPEAETLYGKARDRLEMLVAAHADAPAYRKELADALQNLGVLYQTTNRTDEAAAALGRSLDLRRALASENPRAPVYEQDLASSQLTLAASWQMNHKLPEAEAAYRDAIDRLTRLADRYPLVPDYRHLLAAASNNLGNLLRDVGRPRDAEGAWKKGAALLTELKAEEPAVPSYRQELARGLNDQGIFLASTNRAAEAEKAWAGALALQERLAADSPNNPVYREELAKYHGNLGVLHAQAGRLNQAEASYRRAVALLEELEKADPESPLYWQDLVSPYANLAELLKKTGAAGDGAETCLRRLAQLKQKLAAAYPKVAALRGDAAAAYDALARLLNDRHKTTEAREAEQSRDELRKAADLGVK